MVLLLPSSRRPLVGRLSAAAVAAAAVVSLGAVPASAATPQVVNVDLHACPSELVGQFTSQSFTDVKDTDAFALEIYCIAETGIAAGTTSTTYSPARAVTRAQMAIFFARIADDAGTNLNTASAGFTDIGGLSAEAQDSINALANLGVVNGTSASPKRYSPAANVTRGQMASFINRLQKVLDGKGFTAGSSSYYPDVTSATAHAADINAITGGGIAGGKSDGKYHPTDSVTRAQMAAFIARDLEANAEENVIPPFYSGFPVLDVTPTGSTSLAVVSDAGADQPQDNRTYQVTGLDDTLTYRVVLLPSGDVTTASNSLVTLKDANQDGIADDQGANGCAVILPASGTGAGTGSVSLTPSNGTISFTVDGVSACSVQPLVVAEDDATDTNGNVRLFSDLTPFGARFGVGGVTTYTG